MNLKRTQVTKEQTKRKFIAISNEIYKRSDAYSVAKFIHVYWLSNDINLPRIKVTHGLSVAHFFGPLRVDSYMNLVRHFSAGVLVLLFPALLLGNRKWIRIRTWTKQGQWASVRNEFLEETWA